MSKNTKRPLLAVMALLALVASSAGAASDLWLHVTVDEEDGAKVTVNLPLALAERALPMLPHHGRVHWDNGHLGDFHDVEEMRELWAEVKASPDMTFVTVEEDDETVRVWKESGFLRVEVREGDGEEQVDVEVPLAVVDALLSGEELDFEAAVKALAERGGGQIVSVKDGRDNVRVWIDDVAEAGRGTR